MLKSKMDDGRRTRTVKSLGLLLDEHVVRFFGAERDVRTIRRADLESFKADLRAGKFAPTTINNALTAARQVLKHACVVDELLEAVPLVESVRVSREPKGRAFAAGDVARWQAAPAASEPAAPRAKRGSVKASGGERKQRTTEKAAAEARHILTFIANTALRRSEALAVRFSWVDWGAREIRFPAEHHKGGRPREHVALNEAALEVIRARQALHAERRKPDDDRVFRNSRRMLREATRSAERVGLGKARLHDLRHTRATHLHAAGASLVEVRDMLGHNTLDMVSRYAHTLPERAHLMADAVVLGAPAAAPAPPKDDLAAERKKRRGGK